jgi:hypothetical protein
MVKAGRDGQLDMALDAVEADIACCNVNGDRIDVGRKYRDRRKLGDGDRQHRAAGAKIKRITRLFVGTISPMR